jgi:hypothetical protein
MPLTSRLPDTSKAGSASGGSGGLPAAMVPVSEAVSQRAVGVSKVAWIPPGGLGHLEWLATGRRLGAIGRCSQWWIGDWIRYGTAKWGEKYAEAARVTGYDVASLRNMAWVASRFDQSLRCDRLTWSHHVLLAPLEQEEQIFWLARAVDERLSVADLRQELRSLRKPAAKSLAAEDDQADPSENGAKSVCPHCGNRLNPSAK